MITIRKEEPGDISGIRTVNILAFGQILEADLVDTLRRSCPDALSLVAIADDKVVGHILFSPATIETETRIIKDMGLAPMAVLPEFHRQGIGSQLVRTGLAELRRLRCPFVIVLGHPDYYPRFGFVPASTFGVRSEWDVPDHAFMMLVLGGTKLEGIQGVAKYRAEVAEAM